MLLTTPRDTVPTDLPCALKFTGSFNEVDERLETLVILFPIHFNRDRLRDRADVTLRDTDDKAFVCNERLDVVIPIGTLDQDSETLFLKGFVQFRMLSLI